MSPRWLLSAVILFWGQQTGLWVYAIPAAVLVEAHRFLRRLQLSDADFTRVSTLCAAAFLAMSAYAIVTRPLGAAIMTLVQWFPIVCIPLIAAQRFSTRSRVPAGSLFPLVGRALRARTQGKTVDLGYPFLALCVFAAGARNSQTVWFYAGMLLIAAWALWFTKPRGTKAEVWLAILILSAAIGYAGQLGLHSLQGTVERKFGGFIPGGGAGGVSSLRTTAIGSIGTLKLSGRIALRVRGETGQVPGYLHTATFTSYSASQWIAANTGSTVLRPNAGARSWELGQPGTEQRIQIVAHLSGNADWLPLPDRATRLEGPSDFTLRRDRYGAVQIDSGGSVASYAAVYGSSTTADGTPENADLFVHPALRPVLSGIARQLRLESMSSREKLKAVAAYFQNDFRYSLYQPGGASEIEPLEQFLTRTRAGHCEYFATSTVLLLRTAGVPARYSIGYSVQEWSPLEQAYVVRHRHAHAWTRAYVDGNWEDFDTTPASWASTEAAQASRWQPIQDWLSWWWYRLVQSRTAMGYARFRGIVPWLLLLLAVLVAWIFHFLSKKRVRNSEVSLRPEVPIEGEDSEFYEIERLLEKAGFARRAAESTQAWMKRIEISGRGMIAVESLRPLVSLHYRYRFDPQGLRTQDRARLKFLTASWLAEHSHLRTTIDALRTRFLTRRSRPKSP